jgi:hypothetical protein
MSTQNLLHNIGFGVVLRRMLAPKNLGVVLVVHELTCMVSLKCKIIFIITSTYITFVVCSNIRFFAGTISLEVASIIATVALNLRCATGGNGG